MSVRVKIEDYELCLRVIVWHEEATESHYEPGSGGLGVEFTRDWGASKLFPLGALSRDKASAHKLVAWVLETAEILRLKNGGDGGPTAPDYAAATSAIQRILEDQLGGQRKDRP